MVVDRPEESDLRRRAAWLLGMLALVAALVVVLMVTLLNGGGGGSRQAAPVDTGTATAPVSITGSAHTSAPGAATSASGPATVGQNSSGAPSTSAGEPSIPSTSSCPGTTPCALSGDPGNAIAAINAYRVQHHQQPVTATVSPAAQQCALGNGSGCSGDYAESQVPALTGAAALAKIESLNNSMLDPGLKSFAVGWALVPSSKEYFFAFVAQK